EWKREIRRRLANLKLEPAREAAIVEELSQHLDDYYEELLASGATQAEAERRARAELIESELLAHELRQVERQGAPELSALGTNRRVNMLGDWGQDIGYGPRTLRKHAGLSAVVIATLTVGIGLSAGVFTLINSGLLRARIDKAPASYVEVFSAYTKDPVRAGRPGATTLEDYLAFRDRSRSLRDVAAWA